MRIPLTDCDKTVFKEILCRLFPANDYKQKVKSWLWLSDLQASLTTSVWIWN